MRIVTSHRGKLQQLGNAELKATTGEWFATGLSAIDKLVPQGNLALGSVHELLCEGENPLPFFFAVILARAAGSAGRHKRGAIAWCDGEGTLYPPAAAAAGIALDRLLLIRASGRQERIWAIGECLRCRGVAATVACPPAMSRIEARRLQLAAEAGGGVGILLRRMSEARQFAAATRWLVSPVPGERTLQRWRLQLIHGHGGRVGESVFLEADHATHHVRAFAAVGDRSALATAMA